MKKRIALLLAAVMVMGSLAGCGSKKEEPAAPAATEEKTEEAQKPAAAPEGTPKVAFITQDMSNPSQAYAWTQFQKWAPEYGFEVQLFDEKTDPQNGVTAIGTCISQGFAAMCINPSDPSALIPALQEAKAAGVIVGMYSSELPEGFATTEYRDFMCGTDDVMCGEVAAKTLMEAFPDGVNVVEVGGMSGHSAQIKRHDGFFNTINDKVKVLDSKNCEAWATDDAQAIMEDFIVKYGKDIQAVYCHWDNGATGVINALKAANMEGVYVIGVDGCSVGYDQVIAGEQALCIGQSFSQMTQDAFTCITSLLNGETLASDVVWTNLDVVTADTVKDFPYPEW